MKFKYRFVCVQFPLWLNIYRETWSKQNKSRRLSSTSPNINYTEESLQVEEDFNFHEAAFSSTYLVSESSWLRLISQSGFHNIS